MIYTIQNFWYNFVRNKLHSCKAISFEVAINVVLCVYKKKIFLCRTVYWNVQHPKTE